MSLSCPKNSSPFPGPLTSHRPTCTDGEYGDVFRVGPKTVAVMDPEAIPSIMGIKARLNKGPAYNGFRSASGVKTSLVSIPDDKTHGTYRRPIAHAFSLSSLKEYEGSIDEMINLLIGILDNHAEKNEALNLSDWLYYWSFDVIGKLSFGHPIGFMEHGCDFNGLVKAHGSFLEYVEIVSSWPLLDKFFMGNPIFKFFKYKPSLFVKFAVGKVQERLLAEKTNPASNEKGHPDLLGHFIAAKKTYPDVVTDSQIMVYSGSNVAAGALSTSRVLDMIVLFLAEHPQAQERLHDEVRRANQKSTNGAESEGPEAFDLAIKMPYLEAIILESYRRHSSISNLFERVVSSKGLDLPSGHHLPPGTLVGINSNAMNRRTDIFGADAETFDPLRWLLRDGESEQEFRERKQDMDRAMITFGSGARSCIGKNIVQLELFKVMATLMDLYRFEAVREPTSMQVWVNVNRRGMT